MAKKNAPEIEDSAEVEADEGVSAEAPSKPKKAKKADVYVVVGPLIQATVGNSVLHYRAGDELPAGVSQDELDNLLSLGLVKKQ